MCLTFQKLIKNNFSSVVSLAFYEDTHGMFMTYVSFQFSEYKNQKRSQKYTYWIGFTTNVYCKIFKSQKDTRNPELASSTFSHNPIRIQWITGTRKEFDRQQWEFHLFGRIVVSCVCVTSVAPWGSIIRALEFNSTGI